MLIDDLGNGLIIRHARRDDAGPLSDFNAVMHADRGMETDEGIRHWTRDLLSGAHPSVRTEDFTVVEDAGAGRIVSSLNLIGQTWSYDGAPIAVGQVELVATDPGQRRRGLVRRQFEIVHAWSAERGHLIQVISGIPWYYRQFGYEYALEMDGGRAGYRPQIPPLPAGAPEPYRLRPATVADLPFIARVDARERSRYLVTALRDAALWRYELDGRSPGSAQQRELRVIESAEGTAVGYLAHWPLLWQGMAAVTAYELVDGVSWPAVTPSVLRALAAAGDAYAAQAGGARCDGVFFAFGSDHPVYRAIPDRLTRRVRVYAWYVRVPDVAAFIRHVRPVLEQRLAASEAAGHSGELRLNFYRDGLRLRFTSGRLAAVDPWRRPERHEADASFPDLTFLKLLFGYRSLAELQAAYPDCYCSSAGGAAETLLDILFPARPSLVWAVG